MTRQRRVVALGLFGLILVALPGLAEDADFSGTWKTSFGKMRLNRIDKTVSGTYDMGGVSNRISGQMRDGRFEFRYEEANAEGEGWFVLASDGESFSGQWRQDGSEEWYSWVGQRLGDAGSVFSGLWSGSYGRMRLIQNGDKVHGIYASPAGSTITGTVKNNRLSFQYKEPENSGEGWFELDESGDDLRGKWRPDGAKNWQDWTAKRIVANPETVWLVVIEARWEADLAQREYTFGDMLKSFFDRTPHVQVRRRFFSDENGLRRWCREVAFLAEPVLLCISTHGTEEGISVAGKSIPPAAIAESLRYTDNLQLLHFSACLMMKEELAGQVMKQLGPQGSCPISGYATSVDWASSAVIEFMYFDFILNRRLAPEVASEQVKILFPLAGDKRVPNATLPPAGFRILLPQEKEQ